MYASKYLVLTILLSALLVSCVSSSSNAGESSLGVNTWIDAPLDGSTIPETAYDIVFSAASSNGAVSHFEIQINGILQDSVVPIFETTEGIAKYYYSSYNWLPPAPGTYLIEVRAISGDETGPFSQAQVHVDGLDLVAVPPPEEVPEEETSEEEATDEEEEASDGDVPMFDTTMFYYGGSCTPNQIETEIMVSDPDAFSVVMFYRLRGMDNEERTDWVASAMDPIGSDYFGLTVRSSTIPDRQMFLSAYFQVQIVGVNQAGDEILRTDVVANQITLLACGQAPRATTAPTATSGVLIGPLPSTNTPIPPPP